MAFILGVPFSDLSISGASCDLLPGALRKALWSFSTFLPERGVDLMQHAVVDLGDVDLGGLYVTEALARIQSVVAEVGRTKPLAIIGGDNSITSPAMLGSVGDRGGLITIDAHHDLRDYERDGLSNGSPVRVLLDAGVEGRRVWQIGIRDLANSKVYSDLADKEGITVVKSSQVKSEGLGAVLGRALSALSGTNGIYVDVDLDVVERAFAPAAPAAQPDGLQPNEVAEAAFVAGAHPSVRSLDIVEVDPERDIAGATVRLAALVLLSFLAGVATR
jgi:formiminoglutamase